MIAPGSLVGFLLVFVAVTWTFSVASYVALTYARPRLRASGPRAERMAASLAMLAPPLMGLIVSVSLAGYSLVSASQGQDHCTAHGRHVHLCLLHGGAWFNKLWAVVLVSSIATVVAIRLARRAHSLWTTRRLLHRLAHASQTVQDAAGKPILLAPSNRMFCFVAGLFRPRIYASSAARDQLNADQWQAMLEHERAHIKHGDLWREAALSAFAITGAPIVADRALAAWKASTERLCDQAAARETGDAAAVASAMLVMAQGAPTGACSFAADDDALSDRVTAVLDETADGAFTARQLSIIAATTGAVALVTALLLTSSVHHALETLLGTI